MDAGDNDWSWFQLFLRGRPRCVIVQTTRADTAAISRTLIPAAVDDDDDAAAATTTALCGSRVVNDCG